MSRTYTFKTKPTDQSPTRKGFQLNIKRSFLDLCPKPEEETIETLLSSKFNIHKYFHNTSGPAVIRLSDGAEDFWIDGVRFENESEWKLEVNRK